MGTKTFSQQQKLTILEGSENLGIKEAARVAGVHYTTIYDWRRQLQTLGQEAFLAYQAKYPGRRVKKIDASQETTILDTWKNRPGFGPGQIRNQLRRQGITNSIRTIRSVMQANGYKAHKGRKSTESPQRFEAGGPLELVQMAILEFFINKLKVYLILILDDFSRFIWGYGIWGTSYFRRCPENCLFQQKKSPCPESGNGVVKSCIHLALCLRFFLRIIVRRPSDRGRIIDLSRQIQVFFIPAGNDNGVKFPRLQ